MTHVMEAALPPVYIFLFLAAGMAALTLIKGL